MAAGRTISSGGPRTTAKAGGTGGNTGTNSATSRYATSPGPMTTRATRRTTGSRMAHGTTAGRGRRPPRGPSA
eukprot:13411962-Alexandrium_andersonii.AAC.1